VNYLESMNSRLQVKIRAGDSYRRYSFDQPPSWKTFIDHLKSHLYPDDALCLPFRVEYKDEEDDLVTIDSEEEWQEMLNYKNTNLVTLFIKELPANHNLLEMQRQEELKRQEEIRKQEEIRREEEERKRQEEILKMREEEKRVRVEEEERRKEEEERKKEEERKRQEEEKRKIRDEEERKREDLLFKEEERKLKESKQKEEEEAKYLLCLEKLKLMELEREEKPPHKRGLWGIRQSNTLPADNKNHYIKIYAPKLHTLYEAGFQDI